LFVECLRFEAMPFQLTIKELDRGEPLPEHLKFTPENKNLPTLKRITGAYGDNKRFVSAAFSPDSKVVWMAHAGALSRWEHLGLGQKGGFEWKWMGQYKTPRQCLFALCVDGQGRLYGQPYKSADERHREWDDIHVFEDLNPVKMDGNIPEPAKEIPFGGIAKRMLLSADGRWIYCLDTYNNRLVRIDIKKGAIDKEVKDISASTGSFCLTPDGKKIYCCSAKNRIDLIDAVEFKLIRSVSLDRGQPVDVAATNEGMVFLAGPPVHPSFEGNAYVVDLTGKPAERAIAMPFVTRAASRTVASASVCLHPNQHAVFVACDRAIIAVDVPARPALFRLHAVERFRAQDASWNRMVLSPDGRTIVHETGSILSVSGELRGK
jgi:hypothetical protein